MDYIRILKKIKFSAILFFMTTKEKILDALEKNLGAKVSGQALANECMVSRAAVWKAINSLRQDGCEIEGHENGGYTLKEKSDFFSKEIFCRYLAEFFPKFKNCPVECFKEIDSTNTYAKKILAQASSLHTKNGGLSEEGKKIHQRIILAESQSAGRGRLGRNFISPAKTGIYLSIIYVPKGGISEPARLTAFTAVAVVRAIKKLFSVDAKIKWINDIYIEEKKVCGILTEGFTNFESGQIEAAVIGIGINICDNADVKKAAKVAGSITGKKNKSDVSRCQLAAEVAGQTLNLLQEDAAPVMEEYKANSFLVGRTVEIHPVIGQEKNSYFAKVIDIDDKAGLVVELSDKSKRTLSSGEVSLHQE